MNNRSKDRSKATSTDQNLVQQILSKIDISNVEFAGSFLTFLGGWMVGLGWDEVERFDQLEIKLSAYI